MTQCEINLSPPTVPHPEGYEAFKRYALRAAQSGARVGAKCVVEFLRWRVEVERAEPAVKLNNSNTADWARQFMIDHPEHAGYFATRESGG